MVRVAQCMRYVMESQVYDRYLIMIKDIKEVEKLDMELLVDLIL